MFGVEYLAGITGALALYGAWESASQRARLHRIKYRIHVNGTRGKSSVARLIAAGLRAGGLRTFCKVTGTEARMIMPDESEVPVFRPARANVVEQIRIGRVASRNQADALVIECMALQPSLQWLCERWFVHATHGVITNARPDHLDVMGPEEHDVALALAAITPRGGTLYTADPANRDVWEMSSKDRGSELVMIEHADADAITAEDLAGFKYTEHPDNLALALRVCRDVGVPRDVALQGMWAAKPDSGAMTEHTLERAGQKLFFVNGFAANDPESTAQIWRMALRRHPEVERRLLLVNCRHDRGPRSKQIGEVIGGWPHVDHVLVIGSGTQVFLNAATANGVPADHLTVHEAAHPEVVMASITELMQGPTLAMGVGNIGGVGMALMSLIEQLET